ncbi:MAG: DinB family protein [Ignavibacteriaceae bacterium]|jgi:uncharacterized damage-inducible protein DinB
MKQYLIDTFYFNDYANKNILKKISELPKKKESIRFFSHLINSQNKWLDRVIEYPDESKLDWWEPVYSLDKIESEWNKSLKAWIDFLEKKMDDELFVQVKFIGYDGGTWTAEIKDIALQLNYHSIHHRAQIQTLIRQQGLEPDFIDYIGTKYKKIT